LGFLGFPPFLVFWVFWGFSLQKALSPEFRSMLAGVKSFSIPSGAGRIFGFWVFLGFWATPRRAGYGGKLASVDTTEEILLRFIPMTEAGRPLRIAASSCPGMMECPWVYNLKLLVVMLQG